MATLTTTSQSVHTSLTHQLHLDTHFRQGWEPLIKPAPVPTFPPFLQTVLPNRINLVQGSRSSSSMTTTSSSFSRKFTPHFNSYLPSSDHSSSTTTSSSSDLQEKDEDLHEKDGITSSTSTYDESFNLKGSIFFLQQRIDEGQVAPLTQSGMDDDDQGYHDESPVRMAELLILRGNFDLEGEEGGFGVKGSDFPFLIPCFPSKSHKSPAPLPVPIPTPLTQVNLSWLNAHYSMDTTEDENFPISPGSSGSEWRGFELERYEFHEGEDGIAPFQLKMERTWEDDLSTGEWKSGEIIFYVPEAGSNYCASTISSSSDEEESDFWSGGDAPEESIEGLTIEQLIDLFPLPPSTKTRPTSLSNHHIFMVEASHSDSWTC